MNRTRRAATINLVLALTLFMALAAGLSVIAPGLEARFADSERAMPASSVPEALSSVGVEASSAGAAASPDHVAIPSDAPALSVQPHPGPVEALAVNCRPYSSTHSRVMCSTNVHLM